MLLYKLPRDAKAVKQAVQEYEEYLKETRDGLTKAFMNRRVEKGAAEEMAGLVMEEML